MWSALFVYRPLDFLLGQPSTRTPGISESCACAAAAAFFAVDSTRRWLRALRLRAAACRLSGSGRRSGPVAMSNALHGRWESRRSLVFPSRLVPQCHGWRRSSRHMCSLCSSCVPLAEGVHHTRWLSTTAPHRPATPGPTRRVPHRSQAVRSSWPCCAARARCRPNSRRPELQPITGGGEGLSGRT